MGTEISGGEGVGGIWGRGVGGGRELYLMQQHCHHQNDASLK